jgi:hypothetical protein
MQQVFARDEADGGGPLVGLRLLGEWMAGNKYLSQLEICCFAIGYSDVERRSCAVAVR